MEEVLDAEAAVAVDRDVGDSDERDGPEDAEDFEEADVTNEDPDDFEEADVAEVDLDDFDLDDVGEVEGGAELGVEDAAACPTLDNAAWAALLATDSIDCRIDVASVYIEYPMETKGASGSAGI